MKLSSFRAGFIFSSISFLISGVCGVVLNIIIILKFDLATLGIFNQALVVYILLSQLANMGLSYSTLYFSSNTSFSTKQRLEIIYASLMISVIVGLFFSVLGFNSDILFNYFFKS